MNLAKEIKPTTDNPLSNRGAKAMTAGFSFSAVHVPVKLGLWYSCADLQRLSDPHSHCKQCFPRLGGPRGKHPWQGLSSQTGLALTSRLRAGIGQMLPGWRTKNNWQCFKARLYEVKCHMGIIPFPVYSVYTQQLLSTKL